MLAALVALALAPLAPAQAADPKPNLDAAASAILIDARDGSVLLAKRPEAERSMASTTKLMTALLTLERTKPDQVFTASKYQAAPIESKISLRPGERMRVSDLFEGLMLESANDAAVTLAEGISGSRPAFVRDMNERAAAAGPAPHALLQPDRAGRGRQPLQRARPGAAGAAADARPALRRAWSAGRPRCWRAARAGAW